VTDAENRLDKLVDRADSVRRFLGGDLEGIKEDLSRMIVKRKVLVCLDVVWKVEDAKWFIFETPAFAPKTKDSPYKILITTLVPSLLGSETCQEIFVLILSEHEAVELLLSTAGRRPYGGRTSAVFNLQPVQVDRQGLWQLWYPSCREHVERKQS
jgi:hypothetical protein